MKSIIEEYDKYSVIRLDGQFVGGEETDKLFEASQSVLKTEHKNLLLDFKDVIYFSSIVIGKLIRLNRDFSENEGKLFICNINSTLKEVFRITKVSTFITIKDTIDEAINEL